VVVHAPPSWPLRDALAGRCVIVIDDEAAIREGMHELLSQWVAPRWTASAAQAVELLNPTTRAGAGAGRLPLTKAEGAHAVELLREASVKPCRTG